MRRARLASFVRYDLTQKITDLRGRDVPSEQKAGPDGRLVEDPDSPPLTLGLALFRAALFVPIGVNPTGEEKYKQGMIADKIARAGEVVDLPLPEVAWLHEQVGKAYMPTVVFRVWHMLEPSGANEKVN